MIHPDYLLERLTSRQLSEWEVYDRIDPVGTWREDFRMASLSSLIVNIALGFSGNKDKGKYTTFLDFMPDWTGEKSKEALNKKQSVEEMKKILMDIAQIQNSKFKKE